jgi:hypothetical protein
MFSLLAVHRNSPVRICEPNSMVMYLETTAAEARGATRAIGYLPLALILAE